MTIIIAQIGKPKMNVFTPLLADSGKGPYSLSDFSPGHIHNIKLIKGNPIKAVRYLFQPKSLIRRYVRTKCTGTMNNKKYAISIEDENLLTFSPELKLDDVKEVFKVPTPNMFKTLLSRIGKTNQSIKDR
tara:strand:+ start:971 stop:1360 length:390 start_codon:yes stop_codon:yes gene_type:complete